MDPRKSTAPTGRPLWGAGAEAGGGAPEAGAARSVPPERALWRICRHADGAWQSVRMTDRPSPVGGPAPRRWPADPTQLVDTTCCPACFSPLASTRCAVCGLDLAVPEADELLRRSAAVYRDELARQELIDRMRAAQAAREAWVDLATTSVPVEMGRRGAGDDDPGRGGRPGGLRHRPDAGRSDPRMPRPRARSPPLCRQPQPRRAPPAPPIAPAASAAVERRSGRSGVQVLLLTLGVVLISVTAIVFLFVAYLVASLEVRSVIIAGASVLVLGLAWLLRARRLPGTAEGVASVAVVLLLLDVWIVRANELFGSERLSASAYAGVALAIVAGLLAGTRAASGIRVPGYAAAALAPVSAFLLAYALDPETASGVWLGGLAAVVVGSAVAGALRASPERGILLAAGFVGGAAATIDAPWALPEVAWGASWALLAAGGAWLLAVVVIALREPDTTSPWSWIAAPALGASVALAPVVGSMQELDRPDALWIAPAGAVVVACLFAGAARVLRARREVLAGLRRRRRGGRRSGRPRRARRAPGDRHPGDVGHQPVDDTARPMRCRHSSTTSASARCSSRSSWRRAAPSWLAVFGRLRRLAAIPVAFAAAGAVVAASLAPTVWLAAAALVLLAALALAAAALTGRAVVPGLLAILAIGGISAGGLGLSTAYSSAPVWPWTIAALLALLVAGRLLASRVWPTGSARGIGAAHLTVATVLVGVVAFSIPFLARCVGRSAGRALAVAVDVAGHGRLDPARRCPPRAAHPRAGSHEHDGAAARRRGRGCAGDRIRSTPRSDGCRPPSAPSS